MNYIFLNQTESENLNVCNQYKDWINDWLYKINENIENECISSSECIQGLLCEKVIGKSTVDWKDVEESLLRDEKGRPLAYSEQYGKKLYKFDAQWKQMPVYAIYNSYWISRYYGSVDIGKYAAFIRTMIQPDGWIYNPAVSNTQLRTRMRSELMMSLAMGTEIIEQDHFEKGEKNRFEAVLATIPLTGYISAEYFRLKALRNIDRRYQFPEGVEEMLEKCAVGAGYNDFCVSDKTDDYMGTKKRTRHDSMVHTPLISNMALLLSIQGGEELLKGYRDKMKVYAEMLRCHPMDIPAFTMRDISHPFGAGITPLEILSAIEITNTN